MANSSPSIESIVGEQLSAVSFVQDYVEFHFDGPVVRALSNPTVRGPSVKATFPDKGSRDALCSAIGRIVRSVEVDDDHRAEIGLDGECVITIPLGADNHRGTEAMHFVAAPYSPVQVWE